MKTTIEVRIDEEIAAKADAVYQTLGMDTEMALALFMRRTAMMGRMPMSMDPIQTEPKVENNLQRVSNPYVKELETPKPKAKRGNKITQKMVEDVWDAYLEMRQTGKSANALAPVVTERSGMTQGSAFIYLVILENLEAGKPNTRNMKFTDLEWYVNQIKEELGQEAYENTLKSIEASLENWDVPQFGNFGQRVKKFLVQKNKE